MEIVFFGSGAFGLPTLAHLSEKHRVTGVVTQPDKPAGRGGTLTPTPIGAWAAQHLPGVPLFKPEKVNVPDVRDQIRALPASAWVVIAFGQKLGAALLEGKFAVNLHASLLPRWRGAAPINAAILAGDSVTGNSVITLADKMDAGLVLGQSKRPVEPRTTAGEMHDLLAADGPALMEHVLQEHAAGALSPRVQDESLVTLAGKLSKADGWVDFRRSAVECRQRVHGLTPWPGVTAKFRGAGLKLLRVEALEQGHDYAAGTIADAETGIVACGDGTALRLLEVQPEGGRAMAWSDFARGRRPIVGDAIVGGHAGC
ncbi:MAG: methionyl-tRNA formyltransferase [Planctomycetes bacterium]|nr:methionyl-tRNA formyltransferase [Planctomycetota bacterium]